MDSSGNAFVSSRHTDTVFKIEPSGTTTQILDSTGDGTNACDQPVGVATDAADNVFVACSNTHNVFKITPAGAVTQILDSTGDGAGNTVTNPSRLAVDAAGNVYVACFSSGNVFKIVPGGTVTEIIDATGDGAHNLHWPGGVAVDSLGNVFTTSTTNSGQPEWVFKITPGGVITTFFDPAIGDGVNVCLTGIFGIATDPSDNVYVPCTNSPQRVQDHAIGHGDPDPRCDRRWRRQHARFSPSPGE